MKITTLPVYSKLADDEALREAGLVDKLPKGWRLSQHQVDTYRALNDRHTDVIFNTAMTGDGKSLAGQLGALVDKQPFFAMYPTNELIRDQMRQAEQTLRKWSVSDTVRQARLYSRTLDQLMETGDFTTRGTALLNVLKNADMVLTNPDIFHYVMQFYYTRKGPRGDAPELLAQPLADLFNVFVFDEFHIFQAPQVVAVLNALLFIDELTGRRGAKKYLFLSATPGPLLIKYLERAGLRHTVIQGEYCHGTEDPGPNWRRILHGTDIHFYPDRAEKWLEAHLEDTVLNFFRRHRPGAKGAVIVNSVAAAKRIVAALSAALEPEGLRVGENTGFTGDETRRLSYSLDLLVGTSTIDVGVDFDINFLVFESWDAGSFLQRLGRLGRHDGYQRDGIYHPFHAFEAHALLPDFIYERLFRGYDREPARLEEASEISRARLSEAVREVFPQPTTFAGYARKWGCLQSAAAVNGLANPTIRDSYQGMRERLNTRYETAFSLSMGRARADFKRMMNNARPILDEARSFRGGSPFECGVIDMTERGAERLKTYDLFGLLTNCHVERIAKDDFEAEARASQLDLKTLHMDDLIGYFRLFSFLPQTQPVRVVVNRDIGEWSADRFGKVTLIKGIEVDAPGIGALNSSLVRREFVALLCLCHPAELSRRLRLPFPFPVYPFEARDRSTGAIAFGREALLLEVAIEEKGLACGGGAMFY